MELLFEKFGLSLLLGLLVGLQREKAQSRIAGLRTFPLITCFGTLCALLSGTYGSGILVAGAFGITALTLIGNLPQVRKEAGGGITTEIAMLMMFAVGAYLWNGESLVGIALGGGVAVLLQFKPELHGFAERLGEADVRAIMRFVLIAFIVLPVLPNESYGPFESLNPHNIWLMVVIIVGISLFGYMLSKFLGDSVGTLASGFLGGLASSTATTLSFSKQVKEGSSLGHAATVILIASTVAHLRVLIEIAAVSRSLLATTLVPIGALFLASAGASAVLYFRSKAESNSRRQPLASQTDIRSALLFGATYAAVLLCIAVAKQYLGPQSLYWVAGISGLTDVDAITLSTSNLVRTSQIELDQAKLMILIAIGSNLCLKAGIVALASGKQLFWRVAIPFAVCIAAAGFVSFF